MANLPNDMNVINQLERPNSSDTNKVMSYAHLAVRELAKSMAYGRTSFSSDAQKVWPAANDAAFYGSSFKVRALSTPGMGVYLDAGEGFYNNGISELNLGSPNVIGINDPSALKPLQLNPTAPEASPTAGIVTVPNNSSGNDRIDIVEVTLHRFFTDSSNLDFFNPNAIPPAFQPGTATKTLSYSLDGSSQVLSSGSPVAAIVYKVGTPGVSPTPPATDSGYVKIAQIYVPNGTNSGSPITQSFISDFRKQILPSGQAEIFCRGQMTTTPGTQTLSEIFAPPGFQACAYSLGSRSNSEGGTTPYAGLYIVPGDGSAFQRFVGQAQFLPVGVIQAAFPDLGAGGSIADSDGSLVTIDSGAQAILAAASPAVNVGIGQKILSFTMRPTLSTGTSFSQCYFWFRANLMY